MLKVGDKIRILENGHNAARVFEGDVLEVTAIHEDRGFFETEAPRLEYTEGTWWFHFEDESTGWEKVEEDQ